MRTCEKLPSHAESEPQSLTQFFLPKRGEKSQIVPSWITLSRWHSPVTSSFTFSNCNFKDLHRSHGLDGPSQKGKTSPAHSMCMSPRLPARGSRGWGRSRSSWWFSRDWIVCSGVQLNQINRKWEHSHSRWWACRDERLSRIFQKPSFEAD